MTECSSRFIQDRLELDSILYHINYQTEFSTTFTELKMLPIIGQLVSIQSESERACILRIACSDWCEWEHELLEKNYKKEQEELDKLKKKIKIDPKIIEKIDYYYPILYDKIKNKQSVAKFNMKTLGAFVGSLSGYSAGITGIIASVSSASTTTVATATAVTAAAATNPVGWIILGVVGGVVFLGSTGYIIYKGVKQIKERKKAKECAVDVKIPDKTWITPPYLIKYYIE